MKGKKINKAVVKESARLRNQKAIIPSCKEDGFW